MIHTHTIGRIGKDCRVITGTHGSFMAMDIAVDDYSKGQNVTTWVRVKSNRENHIRLAEYLTKGRLVLVDGTLSASLWEDRNGNSQTQLTITANATRPEPGRRTTPRRPPLRRRTTRTTCLSDIAAISQEVKSY